MKPLQQDDIQDWLNEPKREFRWQHTLSGKIVRAENKGKAIQKFKKCYNLNAKRKELRSPR